MTTAAPNRLFIKKFDITKLRSEDDKRAVTCVLIGKRNTGKTWLMRDFLYQYRDVTNVDVFFF